MCAPQCFHTEDGCERVLNCHSFRSASSMLWATVRKAHIHTRSTHTLSLSLSATLSLSPVPPPSHAHHQISSVTIQRIAAEVPDTIIYRQLSALST